MKPEENKIKWFTLKGESNNRESRYKNTFVCFGYDIRYNLCAAFLVGSCATLFIAAVVIFRLQVDTNSIMGNIEFCTSDDACTAGPCEKAVCRGICSIDGIENCCEKNSDCVQEECYSSVCTSENKCKRIFREDGTGCSDHNECTVSDKCTRGVCAGTLLTRPCQVCVGGSFQPDMTKNNMDCSDGSLCTEGDTCSNGVCSGQQRVCPSETCRLGVCDPTTGCGFENQNKQESDAGCTRKDCINGKLVETPKGACQDGNPCTIDICVEGSLGASCYTGRSVMEHGNNYPVCNSTCMTDDDCHSIGTNQEYICWDGSCLPTDSDTSVRMSHGELSMAACTEPDHARLQMRFFMDSTIDNGHMYVPVGNSIAPIFPVNIEIKDIETTLYQTDHQIRTFFSVNTQCYDLTQDCFPLINGEYELRITRYPCTNIYGTNCQLDQPSHLLMMAPFSISNCPLYDVQSVSVVPKITLEPEFFDVRAVLTDEQGGHPMWLTDVAICIPTRVGMHNCVTNEAKDCPYRGCFDMPDKYLLERVTFLSDGDYTSATTTFDSRYHVDIPHFSSFTGDRCVGTPLNTISFSVLPFRERYEGRTAVVDIKYISPLCGYRRLSSDVGRKLGLITI